MAFGGVIVSAGASLAGSGLSAATIDNMDYWIGQAAHLWGGYINAPSVTITISFEVGNLGGATLAQVDLSTSTVNVGTASGRFLQEQYALYKIKTGTDPNGTAADITITFDLQRLQNGELFFLANRLLVPNQIDPDSDLPSGDEVDFLSVAVHEIGHALGFGSFEGSATYATRYDTFVQQIGNDAFFTGARAVAVAGGNVLLAGRDNRSHLAGPDLMDPAIGTGTREPISPLDVSVLQDLGMSIVAPTSGNDQVYGYWNVNDTISGLGGNDTIYGLSGNDTLAGNNGDDLLIGGDGTDTLLGGNDNDILRGGAGNDTINGGAGEDFVSYSDNTSEAVSVDLSTGDANGIGGLDTIGFDTITNVENASGTNFGDILRGDGNDNKLFGFRGEDILVGNGGNDTLIGSEDNDRLNGGLGADTLDGGTGFDTADYREAPLVVGHGVKVDLSAGKSYFGTTGILGFAWAQEDSLTDIEAVDGSAFNDILIGNDFGNQLNGMDGNDELSGAGNGDILKGGIGMDRLQGGSGSDELYGGDDEDWVVYSDHAPNGNTEFAVKVDLGEGLSYQAVFGTFFAWAPEDRLFDIENAEGTSYRDVLIGNVGNNELKGLGGDDELHGEDGDDTLHGGSGIDFDILDGGAGVDWVTYADRAQLGLSTWGVRVDLLQGRTEYGNQDVFTGAPIWVTEDTVLLIENVEGSAQKDILIGNNANNILNGLAGADGLTGNGGNDTLDGGLGADSMAGGTGDDRYFIDDSGDTVAENANEGNDTVVSSVAYMLPTNVENLVLAGSALAGTGNSLANAITGNSLSNVLDGMGGADTMIGGDGNDTYTVDDAGDSVTENAAEGTDIVKSAINYILGANLENLTLTGIAISGTGNALANVIMGNSADNILDGMGGADTMIGGLGNDSYFIDDFGDDAVEAPGEGNDTVFSSLVGYTLGSDFDNLVMLAGSLTGNGNALANMLVGNSDSNTLDGKAGADAMFGGGGDDTYVVDDAGDVVSENDNEGIDTVISMAHFALAANVENLLLEGTADLQGYGNALENTLTGNAGSNLLDGRAGVDVMIGGLGNDVYFVDSGIDAVVENADEGFDTVYSTDHLVLGNNVENLSLIGGDLQGYGNSLNNVLTGTAGANLLDGRGGNDQMFGGLGNDLYFVDSGLDAVFENADEGFDTVHSTDHLVLGENVENLTLIGGDLQGYGNALNNVLTGTNGANLLDGRGGNDQMFGGLGNDVYFVDSGTDAVFENFDEGLDIVFSSDHLVLGDNVEYLRLTGSADLQGYGNALDNILYGNDGANLLDGRAGADTLEGGGGNDAFMFNAGQANGDIVVDFAGNGAGVGDFLLFVGYGAGATFAQIGSTNQWQLTYNGGASQEIITFANNATVDPSDYSFA